MSMRYAPLNTETGGAQVSTQTIGNDPPTAQVLADLRTNIDRLQVPRSPPAYARAGAEIGYAFLSTSLAMRHITRETEALRLDDRNFLSRTISIDISPSRLLVAELEACRRYSNLRYRTNATSNNAHTDTGEPIIDGSLIWLPIGRIDRRATTPVDLHDQNGALIPRATQHQTLSILNAAMYRLFTLLLEGRKYAGSGGSYIEAFLRGPVDEPRWLLEEAIGKLIFEGSPRPKLDQHPSDGTSEHRERAHAILDIIDDVYGQPFFQLLHSVSRSYLVVAGLEANRSEHRLTYRAPDIPVRNEGNKARAFHAVRELLTWLWIDEHTISYEREFASAVRSYHVSFESDYQVHIRRGILVDGRYRPLVSEISRDLRFISSNISKEDQYSTENEDTYHEMLQDEDVADRARDRYLTGIDRLHNYEVDRELLRAREILSQREAEYAEIDRLLPLQPKKDKRRSKIAELGDTIDQIVAAEEHHIHGDLIREIAQRLEDMNIGSGITLNDDARVNWAHIYWRSPRPWPGSTPVRSSFSMRFSAILADDAPSFKGQVLLVLLGLLATTVATSYAIFGHVSIGHITSTGGKYADSNADAIVAVLLIWPAFLLSRLQIPKGDSVISYLSRPGVAIAYAGVAAVGYLALAVATGSSGDTGLELQFTLIITTLFGLLFLGTSQWLVGIFRTKRFRLRRCGCPRWALGSSIIQIRNASSQKADVVFRSRFR